MSITGVVKNLFQLPGSRTYEEFRQESLARGVDVTAAFPVRFDQATSAFFTEVGQPIGQVTGTVVKGIGEGIGSVGGSFVKSAGVGGLTTVAVAGLLGLWLLRK